MTSYSPERVGPYLHRGAYTAPELTQTPTSSVAKGGESGPRPRGLSGGRQQPGELVPDAAFAEKGGAGITAALPAPSLHSERVTFNAAVAGAPDTWHRPSHEKRDDRLRFLLAVNS